MKIDFLGAAGSVTGSNYLLETDGGKILIDCGMFQGSKKLLKRNYLDFDFDPKEINAVIVTHAHIDHSGLLPKLVKHGFKGVIYTARPTMELLNILLYDSAHIEKMGIDIANKYRKRKGLPLKEPLFTDEDVSRTLPLIIEMEYHQKFKVLDNVNACYKEAGHILGSGFVELDITENNHTKRFVFSGDIGRSFQSFIRDPEVSEQADVLFIESTYGNRSHKKWADTEKELVKALEEVAKSGGTLLIPSFAVGRTQEMIYKFFELYDKHKIPKIPIYIDSPMGNRVTEVYRENKDLYDQKTMEYLKDGKNPLDLKLLIITQSAKDSIALNETPGPKVIVSSSGMCHGGRIMHHLKHNIWKPNTFILFVGYQAKGTLGRQIIEGAEKVKIMGQQVAVKSKVFTIGGLSAHADKDELLSWLKFYQSSKPLVCTVHGDPDVCESFSRAIQEKFQLKTIVPDWKDSTFFTFHNDRVEYQHNKYNMEYHFQSVLDKYQDKINQVQSLLSGIDQNTTLLDKEYTEDFVNKLTKKLEEALDDYHALIGKKLKNKS
ncbi:MAG: MBL fold metallo-hydrolase [Spirochaetes bacterium]|nr:MBL fold metallo-hydrolase [Spirochaetota bacterium]